MNFLKVDRTAFKSQTIAEAANNSEYYKKNLEREIVSNSLLNPNFTAEKWVY